MRVTAIMLNFKRRVTLSCMKICFLNA